MQVAATLQLFSNSGRAAPGIAGGVAQTGSKLVGVPTRAPLRANGPSCFSGGEVFLLSEMGPADHAGGIGLVALGIDIA